MVLRERRQHPRMGGKKLYFMLKQNMKEMDLDIGRDKFLTFLGRNNLLVDRKRSYMRTTYSYHRFRTYKNLVKDNPAETSNSTWAADITYIRTGSGFVYLSLLTDMYSRKIVGWCLAKSLSIEGCLKALKQALAGIAEPAGLIHHSDRGIQYCSREYVRLLHRHKVRISMTQENHCYENAMAERVNGILKDEYLLDNTFKDYKSALKACREAILLYNTKRPHWALNLKTPQEVHQVA